MTGSQTAMHINPNLMTGSQTAMHINPNLMTGSQTAMHINITNGNDKKPAQIHFNSKRHKMNMTCTIQ
jgi:hypothetical protein